MAQGQEITPLERQRHKQAVGTVLLFNPTWGRERIQSSLNESGIDIGLNYIQTLKREIMEERIQRFNDEGKEKALAAYEDLMYWIVNQARQIMSEEILVRDKDGTVKQQFYAQQNRLKALEIIAKVAEQAMQLKMDLGIFERQLGSMKSEERVIDMIAALKEYRKNPKKYDQRIEDGHTGQSEPAE